MKDEEGQSIESCPHPQQKIFIDMGTDLDKYDILRKKSEK